MNNLNIASLLRRTRMPSRSMIVAVLSLVIVIFTGYFASARFESILTASANSVYFNLTSGNLTFAITPSTVNLITTNDNWSGVASVEGYEGRDITATHGVDPQTVLGTEFASNQLPNSPTNVAANKGNPSAFNAGGLAEFDTGTPMAIGFQGNVHANPYMVFYLNTTGRTNIQINYDVMDIDSGSNDSVSPIALQYRVGQTGNFINLPGGFVADATDGGVGGRVTPISVVLPAAAENQAQVQVRIITTNAANSSGSSTPDEWIGVNNVVIGSDPVTTAASVNVSGRVADPAGRAISRAYLTMLGPDGSVRTVTTNMFGYYNFSGIEAGATYTLMVSAKGRTFNPGMRTVTILDEVAGFDFVSEN